MLGITLEIIVRQFEEADRQPLRILYFESRKASSAWKIKESLNVRDFDLHTEGEKILVATFGEKIIGFASVWSPDSFLHNLFVDPEFSRRGVGKLLLTSCSELFSKAPTLKCLTANTSALIFYKSQGWEVLEEEAGPEGPYYVMTRRNA